MNYNSPQLKMVLCSRRHPSMSRPEFFAYLTDVHAPLVLGVPEFLCYLRRYVQNHALLEEDGINPPPAYRHATDRDSVIELSFDSAASLHEATQLPRYLDTIRPDESRFNDLARLIAIPAEEVAIFGEREAPGWKMFDFLQKREDLSRESFLTLWRRDAARLATDAQYRDIVRKRVHNVPLATDSADFAPASAYDGVTEIWLGDFEHLRLFNASGFRSGELEFANAERSFSVLAREVLIHPANRP
jgi:EthD domain